jgi:hypothetical protein
MNPLAESKSFMKTSSIKTADVNYVVETNVAYTKDSNGYLNFDMEDKPVGYVSITIPANNMFDAGDDIAIRRTFTIHRA